MMEMSRRAKRMQRNHKRNKQPALNLVSLMDVFTILVFFLLISSSNVQQLPKKKDIHLPTSVATKTPKETLIIAVTQRNILVQGKQVALIQQVSSNAEPLIDGLEKELLFQASKSSVLTTTESQAKGRAVTIMGDEDIQYQLLRKILATCRQANYTHIAFAAMQQAKSRQKL
jgi:biopolymer transport protein ExbD